VNGKTPREVFGAEQGSELIAHYRRCIELRRPISYEETLDLPVGRRVWQTQLSPVFRGDEIVQLVGSARDVTDQKRLHEELRILSETDALTGVPNRRKISEELDRELSRAQRYGHPMTVLLLDVDKFKTINDELGHDVGDTALRGIARTLASLMRPSDRVGRWGGEEFLILLPETDRTGGRAAAERVRVGIETADVVRDVTITVSIGVAAIGPQRADNPRAVSHTAEGLVATADEELYRAKHAGRNRVSG
jgi:histidinol-phosphatase (PHP family)